MIYLDNAATTPMLPEVIEVMVESMQKNYGNPSSVHAVGREAKSALVMSRKNIANHFKCTTNEIVFTSGGSESINMVLMNAVMELGVKTLVTSPIEHHAVIHTLEYLVDKFGINIKYVKVDERGIVDYADLEEILANHPEKKLVSLMMVNNEVGSLLDLNKVGEICRRQQTLFMSDTVQAVGHYEIDLAQTPVDFITSSAHKFHGPKGVGLLFVRKGIPFKPLLHGAQQEQGLRAGTENVHAILGMAKAIEIAYANLEEDKKNILDFKNKLVNELKNQIPDVQFNAHSEDSFDHAYHILSVRLPKKVEMALLKLDMKGIAVSGGSACQSGADKGSHVLRSLLTEEETQKTSIRLSFCKNNSINDIDYVVKNILELL